MKLSKTLLLLSPALMMALPSVAKAPKKNAAVNQRTQPNVIVLLADDLGYGDLGCYGATRVETPNVNALAQHGVRFTNAHAVAATSTPSRYSLLTGEYSWRRPGTDIARGNASMIIRPEQFTMADMFKSRGYATAAIGKWHLGLGDKAGQQDWNAPLPCALGDLGFDYHYIMAATGDRVPCVFIEQGMVADYDPSAPIEVNYDANFPGEPTGADHPEMLYNLKPSHGHDMSIVNGISRIGFMKGGGKALWKDENIADSIASHAIGFIREHQDEPFFMYCCTNDVHVPRFPHERFRGKSPMGYRGDAILQFDWTVGQIVGELERLGIADNTLIVLTSDNGPVVDDGYADRAVELLGDHRPAGPFRGGKYSAFEGGTQVPCIAYWPKHISEARESDALVSHIDLFRSFAGLIGATLPKGSAPDSKDALATLLGDADTDREYVVEQAADHTLSIRTSDWKYISTSNGEAIISWGPLIETGYLRTPQLYDMRKVDERENEAAQHPEIVYDLQQMLKDVQDHRK